MHICPHTKTLPGSQEAPLFSPQLQSTSHAKAERKKVLLLWVKFKEDAGPLGTTILVPHPLSSNSLSLSRLS